MNLEIIAYVASCLKVKKEQVEATLKLLEEGNTIPFIARYRKEVTQGLDEEQIRLVEEQYNYQCNLLKRKEDVIRLIDGQGKLNDELKASILACVKLSEVEDLYRPYQQKRKTKASVAIALGLQPYADYLLQANKDSNIDEEANKYLKEELKDIAAIKQGANDIIAQMVSDDVNVRKELRMQMEKFAKLVTKESKKHDDDKKVYKLYYDFSKPIKFLANHQIMAIDRGEKEKVFSVSFDFDASFVQRYCEKKFVKTRNAEAKALVIAAIEDGLKRLLIPSIEREIRKEYTQRAHEASIELFSLNLEKLLSQPPLKNKMILGFDPGFRTGSKLAVIDEFGAMKEIAVIYPHPPINKKEQAKKIVLDLLKRYPIDVIAIGNGTASRESEAFIAELIKENNLNVAFTLVSEAGASVYSASELARKEFPDLQVEQRSAISIARRVIDPLAELIKIDPQSIGVGQYQHDIAGAQLKNRLDFVVSKVVNRVGVNVNTASEELLTHISGLSKASAKAIVTYRNENQGLKSRDELRKVPKIGPKSYQQAAGFLRIEDGEEFLDRTSIHPESYELTYKLMKQYAIDESMIGSEEVKNKFVDVDVQALANTYSSDIYTLQDILNHLCAPLKDYRDQYDAPLLRSDVLEIEDLHIGDELEGIVRNVVDFGAFVDIGLHEDALIHVSQLSKNRNKMHPSEMVALGDVLKVWVHNIDSEKQKVQLTLIPPRKLD